MIHTFQKKKEELQSPILALLFFVFEAVIWITMLGPFALFGLHRGNLKIRHLEIYLVLSTLLFTSLILGGFQSVAVGWIAVFLGAARIFQIIALNSMTLLFGSGLLAPEVTGQTRSRWHFVAILFSIIDGLLIFGFLFWFLNQQYAILNIRSDQWIDHFYFSMVTMISVGYGDIVPVTPLGKVLALSEAVFGIFLFVFLVNSALTRYQRHTE